LTRGAEPADPAGMSAQPPIPVRRTILLLLAASVAACGTPVPIKEKFPPAPIGTGATLAGTVSYGEPVMLPDGAVVEVRLQDMSRADGATFLLGRGRSPAAGLQGNISYSLSYDPARIQPGGQYGVTARIEVGNQILFVSGEPVPVLTGDDRQDHAGRANIRVRPAAKR